MRARAKGLFSHPYVRFVAKKVVFYAIVAFVAMTFVFLIPRLMPGNPVERMISSLTPGGQGSMTNYLILKAKLTAYFGLDKPWFDQYINFWGEVFTLNLGPSYPLQYPEAVLSIVLSRLPYTFAIVIPVLLLSFFLGNWIGAKAAYVGGKRSELVYFFSVFSNRLPSFWFGMVLVFVFAATIKIFPAYGITAMNHQIPTWDLSYFLDVLYHYSLPFLTLFIVYVGGWATGMRSMVIHEMDSGYVRYGEQLGFRKSKLMSYAERNAILPQFTGLNLLFNALIGETAILEIVFGWPGIGKMMYDAVAVDDYSLILGGFLVILVVVILGNFLVDILYGFIDPRIRTGRGR
jgi:peptide/nickel transport system permease protein